MFLPPYIPISPQHRKHHYQPVIFRTCSILQPQWILRRPHLLRRSLCIHLRPLRQLSTRQHRLLASHTTDTERVARGRHTRAARVRRVLEVVAVARDALAPVTGLCCDAGGDVSMTVVEVVVVGGGEALNSPVAYTLSYAVDAVADALD